MRIYQPRTDDIWLLEDDGNAIKQITKEEMIEIEKNGYRVPGNMQEDILLSLPGRRRRMSKGGR